MLKAYKYRLLPTPEQGKTLSDWMSMCRFVYNLGLEVKATAWKSARINISSYELMRQLTELKNTEQCKWLSECSSQSLESALANLDKAYKGLFKGGGFPKFKKRSGTQSITFRQDSKIHGNKIQLTKIGLIDFIQHRKLGEGVIRKVVVSKTPADGYFVSILIMDETPLPDKKVITDKTAIGIDVGLKAFAILSDGTSFENPKYLSHQLKRLRIEQRTLARRYKKGVKTEGQSKGWHNQKLVVAKLHEKIKNKRQDFLHKTSTEIIKNHDTVCLEDLNIKGMMQNRKLAKAISDVSWSEFNRMLEYKADWYGKNIIKIGRFQPSSKTCFDCGAINNLLKLSDREWVCSNCGILHDRDENAAKNIKSFGLEAKPSTANVGQKVKRIGCERLPLADGGKPLPPAPQSKPVK